MGESVLKILTIGAGGFTGAILRYLVGGWVHRLAAATAFATFPLGTMTVNVAGCLLIGLGMGLVETRQLFTPQARSFIFIGFLGSFTTFSTFGFETLQLARDGQASWSLLNITISLVLGLAAVLGGNALSRLL